MNNINKLSISILPQSHVIEVCFAMDSWVLGTSDHLLQYKVYAASRDVSICFPAVLFNYNIMIAHSETFIYLKLL